MFDVNLVFSAVLSDSFDPLGEPSVVVDYTRDDTNGNSGGLSVDYV